MTNMAEEIEIQYDPEPRWPAAVAVLAAGGLYLSLPAYLTIGPRWLFPLAVIGLLVPTVVSHSVGRHRLNAILGFSVTSVLTAELIISLVQLIRACARLFIGSDKFVFYLCAANGDVIF